MKVNRLAIAALMISLGLTACQSTPTPNDAQPANDTVMEVVGTRLDIAANANPLYQPSADSTRLATSGDGQTLALAEVRGSTHQVVLLDALTGRVQSTIDLGTQPISALALDRNGSTLAVSRSLGGASPQSLQVFNRAGQRLATLDNGGLSIALSPDGRTLAYGDASSSQSHLRVVEIGNGHELARADFGGAVLRGVAFSPDGSRVAGIDGQGHVQLLEVGSGRGLVTGLQEATFHFEAALNALSFSSDGRQLIIGGNLSDNGVLVVLDGQNLQRDAIIRIPSERLTSLALSPDGSRLLTFGNLTGDMNATRMRVWDWTSRSVIATQSGVRSQGQMGFIGADATRIGVLQFEGALRTFQIAIGQ